MTRAPFFGLDVKMSETVDQLPKLRLRRGQERRIRTGHPWVFSNELDLKRSDPVPPGGLARLVDSRGEFVATVYHNPATLIACRVLARRQVAVDRRFLGRRLAAAAGLRKRHYPGLDALRLVFSESDGMPGLVIDRYGPWLSVQILTAGMDRLREPLLEAIENEYAPGAGMVVCTGGQYREQEGIEASVEIRRAGEPPRPAAEDETLQVEIDQNGCRFRADLLQGQKTGFFFDQRENRECLDRLIRPGHRVADICCYTGSWAIRAAVLGADAVVGVDSSAPALELAVENAALNSVGQRVTFKRGDALKKTRELAAEGNRFDVVVGPVEKGAHRRRTEIQPVEQRGHGPGRPRRPPAHRQLFTPHRSRGVSQDPCRGGPGFRSPVPVAGLGRPGHGPPRSARGT
jgi:23S rRNA (cytosine1962-C5)-methyltransferase